MKRGLKNKIWLWTFLYVSSFMTGFTWWHQTADLNLNLSREIASTEKQSVSYENLQCPTEEEFKALKKRINFVGELQGTRCDSATDKGKFAKLLRYASDLKLAVPQDWQGGSTEALKDPLGFIGSLAQKTTLCPASVSGYYAYYRSGASGGLSICSAFFEHALFSGLATLVHEVGHGTKDSLGSHVRCPPGHLYENMPACDSTFATTGLRGAYSYELSFVFGLAKLNTDLSAGDRNFLIADGLRLLGQNFLKVSWGYATAVETLVTLDDQNNLYLIHPLLKKHIKLHHWPQIHLNKIKFDRRFHGLILMTKNQGVCTVANHLTDSEPDCPKTLKSGTKDIETLTWIMKNSQIHKGRHNFIDENNKIWKVNEYKLNDVNFNKTLVLENAEGKNLIQLINGYGNDRYVLAESGELFALRSVDSIITMEKSKFQDPTQQGWTYVHGGKNYSDLFGLNKEGALFYRFKPSSSDNTINAENNNNYIKRSDFQVENSRIYFELLNSKVQMDDVGNVFIKKYSDKDVFVLAPPRGMKIKSIAYTRIPLPAKILSDPPSISHRIRSSCGLSKKIGTDPWTGLAMGIDENNELVFQVSEKKCETLPLEKKVKDYKIVGSADQAKEDPLVETQIEVTFLDGTKRRLRSFSPQP